MVFVVTPGQHHENASFVELMEGGAIKTGRRGRPRQRPNRVVGDKGYTGRANRSYLRRRGIRVTIPRRSNERRRGSFDRAAYRKRNLVERLFNRLKQFRRIATRYEKRKDNYLAMLTIAACLLWL
jgi:transposase